MTHTADTCTIETHDHWGQIEAAANFGLDAPMSDELACFECGRKIFWDEADQHYHHLTEPERGCFLIPPESDGVFESSWPPKMGIAYRPCSGARS